MPQPAPETYADYPLIILSQDGKREIARLTVDKSGNYRIALPPGAYILAGKNAQQKNAPQNASTRTGNHSRFSRTKLFASISLGSSSRSKPA